MTVAESVRALAACPRPRCRAPIGTACETPTGRNHAERVHDAIAEALRDIARERGIDPAAIGLGAKP